MGNPGAYQDYLRNKRETDPTFTMIGPGLIEVAWSEEDHEIVRLNAYERLLAEVVSEHVNGSTMGFDTGIWPDGKPWDEHPLWLQTIWIRYRLGRDKAHAESRMESRVTEVDRQPGEWSDDEPDDRSDDSSHYSEFE